jgi:hypothetical protein
MPGKNGVQIFNFVFPWKLPGNGLGLIICRKWQKGKEGLLTWLPPGLPLDMVFVI